MKRYFFRLDDLRAIPCVLRYADNCGMLEDLMPEFEDQLDGIGWCIAAARRGAASLIPDLGTRNGRGMSVTFAPRRTSRSGWATSQDGDAGLAICLTAKNIKICLTLLKTQYLSSMRLGGHVEFNGETVSVPQPRDRSP
jgi:hypothetical protein